MGLPVRNTVANFSDDDHAYISQRWKGRGWIKEVQWEGGQSQILVVLFQGPAGCLKSEGPIESPRKNGGSIPEDPSKSNPCYFFAIIGKELPFNSKL